MNFISPGIFQYAVKIYQVPQARYPLCLYLCNFTCVGKGKETTAHVKFASSIVHSNTDFMASALIPFLGFQFVLTGGVGILSTRGPRKCMVRPFLVYIQHYNEQVIYLQTYYYYVFLL